MKNILYVQVQKLFLITLVLKIGSSFLGWYFQMPWSLGFTIPLLIMTAYIVLGYYRRDSDVTDEKFADTCYYLGFIFTITSIIFSLFDLPNIGTKIQEIAVRFGAAMVSTVLGLSVRVFLVSFKQDVSDAIQDAEDAVLEAARRFSEQLTISLERLQGFETQVDAAARSSVERVNLQVGNLSKNHAEKLTSFFADLTNSNQQAFTLALAEVKTASGSLAESVDGYSQGMRSNLTSIEAKVDAFTNAVTNRLKTTTFPDDYFSKRLEGPLSQITESAALLAQEVKQVSTEVSQSSVALSGALKKIRDKANATENSLDTVLRLSVQQQAVLDSAQAQLTTIGQLAINLDRFDSALTSTLAGITASNLVSSQLTSRVSSIVEEGVTARRSLEESLASVIGKLDFNAGATSTVALRLDANSIAAKVSADTIASQLQVNATATDALTARLDTNTAASELIVAKLEGLTATDVEAVANLGTLGQHASKIIGKVDQAVQQLQDMVHQLSGLDSVLRAQSSELKQVADQINDVKIVVEMSEPVVPHISTPLLATLPQPLGVTESPVPLGAPSKSIEVNTVPESANSRFVPSTGSLGPDA